MACHVTALTATVVADNISRIHDDDKHDDKHDDIIGVSKADSSTYIRT